MGDLLKPQRQFPFILYATKPTGKGESVDQVRSIIHTGLQTSDCYPTAPSGLSEADKRLHVKTIRRTLSAVVVAGNVLVLRGTFRYNRSENILSVR